MHWCWFYRNYIGWWNVGIDNIKNLWLLNVHTHSWDLDIINVRWIHSWAIDMVDIRWIHSWDFDVADWTSRFIGKNKLLWLVDSKRIDARDQCIWNWDNIPTTPNNFLSCVERHKFKAALQVSIGTKRNGALCYGVLDISRSILLMHLTVFSNLETQVFLVINDLNGHYGFWTQSVINSALRWEEIEQFYCLEQNVYCQYLGNALKCKAMPSCLTPFLHHPNFAFDFGDMVVGACQINHGTTR